MTTTFTEIAGGTSTREARTSDAQGKDEGSALDTVARRRRRYAMMLLMMMMIVMLGSVVVRQRERLKRRLQPDRISSKQQYS